MSIVLGRGQCGAHITLLFTIDDSSEDLVYQGSRGAGICLKDGVEASERRQWLRRDNCQIQGWRIRLKNVSRRTVGVSGGDS